MERRESSFADLARSAAMLRSLIEKELFLHYRQIDQESRTIELLQPLVEAFSSPDGVPPVFFTTNYDPAVEKFCQLSGRFDCVDGFRNNPQTRAYEWDSRNFEHSSQFDRSPLYLFKLHGST